MVKLKQLFLLLITLFILMYCQGNSTLYLNGDKESIDSRVYIDDVFYGKMKPIKDGAGLTVNIKPGKHKLLVINNSNKEFKKDFYIKGENYIAVTFDNTLNSNSTKNN